LQKIALSAKVTRHLVPAVLFSLALDGFAVAQVAQTDTTPSALFQYSAITGTTSVINVSRAPVTNSKGKVAYWDMTLTFNVNSSGTPTLLDASISPSPVLLVGSFKPGTYTASADPEFTITASGPGVAGGGTTVWSISSTTTVCGLPSTAQWWTGPIANNPLAKRIEAAKITSTEFAYGAVGTNGDCWPFYNQTDLIGVSQVGNTLTFTDFTNADHKDQSTPQGQAVFILKK
jgi:hypothetical protein